METKKTALQFKLLSDIPASFINDVMRINGVEHYQIMTRFTQPGVIFAKKEDRKKVSVADILIGCRVVFYNDTHKHIDGLDAIADLCQRHTNDVSLGAFYTEILSRVIKPQSGVQSIKISDVSSATKITRLYRHL